MDEKLLAKIRAGTASESDLRLFMASDREREQMMKPKKRSLRRRFVSTMWTLIIIFCLLGVLMTYLGILS